MNTKQISDAIIQRSKNREYFYRIALKLFTICDIKGIRLIVENPYCAQHYLVNNFPYVASVIDRNRTKRGDYYNKPTQYWFINCQPSYGKSYMRAKEHMTIRNSKKGKRAGLCSEERSMISPDYARNFILDFILGKSQTFTQLSIF